MIPSEKPKKPKEERNILLFLFFRVLFSARFYYPVFSILFLDLGISLEVFSYLNLVWALTIILFEVPSGALADALGRKKLIVLGACLYVMEMLLILFAPAHGGAWLMLALFANRVLSGLAEATISGADEALAYDTLLEKGRESEWPKVLERLQRWTSLGFFLALVAGGALYDASLINKIINWTGLVLGQEQTMRFPLLAGLFCAVAALGCALGMHEPKVHKKREDDLPVGAALAGIKSAVLWLLRCRVALVIILASVAVDNVIRVHLTTYSNYLTAIQLTPALFGVVSAALSVVTLVTAWWPRRLVEKRSIVFNFSLVNLLTLASLFGISFLISWWGVVFLVFIRLAMANVYFFLSHYINQFAEPSLRATILSLRGLLMNLGYALACILFALLSRYISSRQLGLAEQTIYEEAVKWLPWYFLVLVVMMVLFSPLFLRGQTVFFLKPHSKVSSD